MLGLCIYSEGIKALNSIVNCQKISVVFYKSILNQNVKHIIIPVSSCLELKGKQTNNTASTKKKYQYLFVSIKERKRAAKKGYDAQQAKDGDFVLIIMLVY
jgi:hypothetical protein